MPAGVAPAGSEVGEVASSVRLPPLTANVPTAPILLSSTYRKRPSGLSRASTAPTPPVSADGGAAQQGQRAVGGDLVTGDLAGSGVHGEQELAVMGDLHPARRGLAIGERGAGERCQRAVKGVAERGDGAGAGAALCALETKSWLGLVGRNSLPNGPRPWAGNGEPGAAVSRPSKPTVKLSISEVPTSVPTSLVPVVLNSTSAGRGTGGQRDGRPGDRMQLAEEAEPEAGVVAAAGTGVGHVHQVAVDGDADRQETAGGDHATGHEAERAVAVDPQHRDLVAARVNGEQEPAARVTWIAPCEASPAPVPAPPVANGEPGSGVSEPSACRSNAPIVLVPAVLSLT